MYKKKTHLKCHQIPSFRFRMLFGMIRYKNFDSENITMWSVVPFSRKEAVILQVVGSVYELSRNNLATDSWRSLHKTRILTDTSVLWGPIYHHSENAEDFYSNLRSTLCTATTSRVLVNEYRSRLECSASCAFMPHQCRFSPLPMIFIMPPASIMCVLADFCSRNVISSGKSTTRSLIANTSTLVLINYTHFEMFFNPLQQTNIRSFQRAISLILCAISLILYAICLILCAISLILYAIGLIPYGISMRLYAIDLILCAISLILYAICLILYEQLIYFNKARAKSRKFLSVEASVNLDINGNVNNRHNVVCCYCTAIQHNLEYIQVSEATYSSNACSHLYCLHLHIPGFHVPVFS